MSHGLSQSFPPTFGTTSRPRHLAITDNADGMTDVAARFASRERHFNSTSSYRGGFGASQRAFGDTVTVVRCTGIRPLLAHAVPRLRLCDGDAELQEQGVVVGKRLPPCDDLMLQRIAP